MKKIYSLLLVALISVLSTTVWAETVSKEEAIQLATNFFSTKMETGAVMRAPASRTTGSLSLLTPQNKQLSLLQGKAIATLPNTTGVTAKSAGLPTDQLVVSSDKLTPRIVELPKSLGIDQFYVIQNEGGKGWVLMAANDVVQPILAYSDEGTLDLSEEMPDNLRYWLGMYNRQIKSAVEGGQTASSEVSTEWSNLRKGVRKAKQATVVVGPLVTSKWNQGYPYNEKCPNYTGSNGSSGQAVTGCVATAMAQVMYYWNWPTQGQGSNSYTSSFKSDGVTYSAGSQSVNFANQTYNWASMDDTHSSSNDAVSTLMYHCGVAVSMKYGPSSGAQTIRFPSSSETYACAQNALWKYFKYHPDSIKGYYRPGYSGQGYSSWTETNWKNMLKTELDKHRPIMYAGSDTDGAGHSFVCDGYRSDDYFHFNWGWGGRYDGYFTVNTLNPGTGGIGSGSGVYSEGQDVIIGIVPNRNDKYKITFSQSSLGTLVGSSTWTQTTVGQSCTLPNVTINDPVRYIFLGWSNREGSETPNVGKAGDSYTPMRNITLYPVIVANGNLVYFFTGEMHYSNGELATWSNHGTSEVDSLRENGIGAGILLPNVESEAGWTFDQWLELYNGSLYNGGYPGDRFYPTEDTTILVGYWTDDSKVELSYSLTGVTKLTGPDAGEVTQADGLTATFRAQTGYNTLTTADVTVKVGGATITPTVSVSNGVLTVSLTPEQMTAEVVIYVTAVYNNCSDYSYTYTAKATTGNSVTLGAYTWSITTNRFNVGNYNNTYGAAFTGSSNMGSATLTYTTSSASSCEIASISVQATASVSNVTLEVKIGNNSLGSVTLTANDASAVYTFNNPGNYQGNITLTFKGSNFNNRSVYIKSINVNMAKVKPVAKTQVTLGYMDCEYYPDDGIWYVYFGYLNNGRIYLPAVITIFAAPSMTSIAGTRNGMQLLHAYVSGSDTLQYVVRNVEFNITYKGASTTYNGYYTYHVYAEWEGTDGTIYYIDGDQVTTLYYTDDDGNEQDITPTGDSSPRYFKVNYYLQNIDGAGYTLDETITGTGATNDVVEGTVYNYYGFIAPAAQTKTLTTNNTSTNPAVINYYYDRRKFPVTFVVNNIVVQQDSLRYQATPVYSGPDPKRDPSDSYSYEFSGWLPILTADTRITQAKTYTAQFNAISHCTVRFDVQDIGTAPDPQVLEPGAKATRPANPTATGYDFVDWYTDLTYQTAWNFNTAVNSSMTLYAKWTPHTHSLTWNANGGTLSGTYTSGDAVAYGTAITAPTEANISRQGYHFDGWTLDGTTVVTPAATMPDNALAYIAKWSPRTDIQYIVKHLQQNIEDNNFSEVVADRQTLQGTMGQSYTPARKSYTGFTAPAAQTITIDGTGNQVISYQYTRNKHTLAWDANEGTIIGSYTSGEVKFGATINAPQNVTRTGYTFAGWHNGTAIVTPATTMPDNDLTYTAQWNIKTYDLTFTSGNPKAGSVTVNPNKTTFNYNESVTITANTNTGYTFTGWSDGNTTNPRTFTVNDATTSLVARFASASVQYIVHHMKQNIDDDEYTEQLPVDYEQGLTDSLTAAVAFDYVGFNPVLPIEQQVIKGDGTTEVEVKYNRKTFAIRFLVDGVEKQNETLRYQAPISYKGVQPTRTATTQYTFTFAGWSPELNAADVATHNQDYVAQFDTTTNKYTVSFNKQGHGANTASQTIAYGSKVVKPADLSETGYTFGGWFKEAACTNAWNFDEDVVTGPTELFAKWTVHTHNLSWISDGDALSGDYTSGSVAFGTPIVRPNTPTKTGYTFAGWHNGTAIVTPATTMPDNNLTYTATWTANTNTEYTVEHWLENIENSEYTKSSTETLTGTTAEDTNAEAREITGFTVEAFSQGIIAADGSTVIRINYKRNVHTLSWNANEGVIAGTSHTSGQVKFGTPITAPEEANVTRTGWEFDGWDPEVPANMPDKDLAIKATWRHGNTDYTVKHYKQNVDGTTWAEPIVESKKGETATEVTPPVKEFEGFTAPTPETGTIADDGSLVIEYYYTRNKYNLQWKAGADDASIGGSFTSGDIYYEANITAPSEFARPGYTFAGWNGEVPTQMPAHAVVLTAKWNANTNTPYFVKHLKEKLNGEWEEIVENLTGTTDATVTPAVQHYEGFTAPAAQEVKILGTGNLVVTYKYTRNSYELVWDANGGQLSGDYTYGLLKFETPITAPADPVREGYKFLGWDNDIPASVPVGGLTLTAHWQIISFTNVSVKSENTNKGTVSITPDQESYDYGTSISIEANAKQGYHFTGWNDGNTESPRAIVIKSDTAFTALFAANTNTQYTIRHLKETLEGGWEQDGTDEVRNDGVTAEWVTIEPNTYEGFKTPNAQTWQIAADGSTVFEYKYTRNSYSISWDANGGELSGDYSTEAKFEAQIAEPEISREGYNFLGWNIEVPATMPANALSFIAQWEAKVYNNVNIPSGQQEGGYVSVNPEEGPYSHDQEVTIIAVADEGYTFDGWSDGEAASERIVIIAGDTTITAIFTPKNDTKFVIRRFIQNLEDDNFSFFDEEEGQGTTGATVSPEPAAIEGFETPAVQSLVITGDGKAAVVYNYVRKSFNLVWNANGGNIISTDHSEGAIKFEAPITAAQVEFNGRIFKGWDPAEIPATMPAKDLTFTAQWQKETFTNVNISSSDETAGKVTVTPAKDTYEYGDELTIVAEANEGYAFSGWSDGNMDGAERTLVIDGDTTIVAIFVPRTDTKYIVRYMLQNIEDDEFTVVDERNLQGTTGAEVEPEVIELEGFTAPAVQKASIKADGSLIIEYRYIRNRYFLTWDADGGILVGEFTRDSVKFGTPIIAPEVPTKEGFLFLGWNIAIPATMPAEDVTIVAQWEKDDQGIEIVVEGGTIISNEEIHIYDFNGRDVTGWNGHLGSGMYIVVGGGSVQKIIIR